MKSIIYFSGMPGTGKSTLASFVGRRLRHAVVVRRNGVKEMLQDFQNTEFEERMIYRIVYKIAAEGLSEGYSIVIDGAGWERKTHDRFRRLAKKMNTRFLSVRLHCTLLTSHQRTAKRERKEYRWSISRLKKFEKIFECIPYDLAIDTNKSDVAQSTKLLWKEIEKRRERQKKG